MAPVTYDAYNHLAQAPGTAFATAASGSTTAGTVAPVTAGAGAGSSTALITGQVCNDTRGSFNLVTAGSPAAGAVAHVNFANPYSNPIPQVIVQVLDTTASPAAPILAVAGTVSQTGFDIQAGALTTAHTYTITYEVTP